jgi:glycosyltransferase involved in cell wall biosynthesis
VCTRDRGASIAATLQSLLTSTYTDFDVIIVDQSASDDTQHAIRDILDRDSRHLYIKSATHGSSVARNIALSHARGEIVAFTDDDCDVSPDWLTLITGCFAAHGDVAVICGEVRPAAHDAHAGFIPTYHISRTLKVSSPWLKWRESGISANMAFRRGALEGVGSFDEVLGAGCPLYSCEDKDLTYRMLRAGFAVLCVPEAYVIHRGFRNWREGQVLMRQSGMGVGAAFMKHLRLGDLAVLPTLGTEWIRCISWKNLLLFRRHSGMARFLWFARGMYRSFGYDIDRATRTYVPPTGTSPVSHHLPESVGVRK